MSHARFLMGKIQKEAGLLKETLELVELDAAELHASADVEAAQFLRPTALRAATRSDADIEEASKLHRSTLLASLGDVARTTGDVLRVFFKRHVASQRAVMAHARPGLRGADANATDVFSTPVLRPLHRYFVALTAPETQRQNAIEDCPRPFRQTASVVTSLLRCAAEPRLREDNIAEITDAVAPGLSGSLQDDVAREYRVVQSTASHKARRRTARAGLPVAEDLGLEEDAVAHEKTQDNFGRVCLSEWRRREMTTTWIRALKGTPDFLSFLESLSKDWLEMRETGIEDDDALQPQVIDHAFLRVTAFEYYRAVDALPAVPEDPEDVSLLAAPNLGREQRPSVSVSDVTTERTEAFFRKLGVDEEALRLSTATAAAVEEGVEEEKATELSGELRGSPFFGYEPMKESVWERESVHTLMEKDANFAEAKEVMASVCELFDAAIETDGPAETGGLRRCRKMIAYAGDGAPIMALQKSQRVAFKVGLERADAGQTPFPEDQPVSLDASYESEDDEDAGDEVPEEERLADEPPRAAMRNNLGGSMDARSCAALMSTTLLMGVWHMLLSAMRSALKLSPWLTPLAALFRRTEGRVNFLFNCGKLRESMGEVEAILAGVTLFELEWWRKDEDADHGDYGAFDAWLDTGPCAACPALRALHEFREVIAVARNVYFGMRSGNLPFLLSALRHLRVLSAVTGGDKYTRGLTEFMVMLRTMPERDLAMVCMLMFVDMGISGFVGADEFTENLHWLINDQIGSFASEAAFRERVKHCTVHMASSRAGCGLGASRRSRKPPVGFLKVKFFIVAQVRNYLRGHFFLRKPDVDALLWLDPAGKEYHCESASRDVDARANEDFGNQLPANFLDGHSATPVSLDPMRAGRAIVRMDDALTLFPPPDDPLRTFRATSRTRLPRPILDADAQRESDERRRLRRSALAPTTIDAAIKKYKKGMVDTIQAYVTAAETAEPEEPPETIKAELLAHRRALVPLLSETRAVQAQAISRWRTLDADWCSRVEEARGVSGDPSSANVDDLMRREQSSAQLRHLGRDAARGVFLPRPER
ncbi:MAG: hypothetical protein AAFV01_07230, partial [Bacteroidota bacterium]